MDFLKLVFFALSCVLACGIVFAVAAILWMLVAHGRAILERMRTPLRYEWLRALTPEDWRTTPTLTYILAKLRGDKKLHPYFRRDMSRLVAERLVESKSFKMAVRGKLRTVLKFRLTELGVERKARLGKARDQAIEAGALPA